MKKILILFLFCIGCDTEPINQNYFPLSIGFEWEIHEYEQTFLSINNLSPPFPPTVSRIKVSRDTLIDNKKFYKITQSEGRGQCSNSWTKANTWYRSEGKDLYRFSGNELTNIALPGENIASDGTEVYRTITINEDNSLEVFSILKKLGVKQSNGNMVYDFNQMIRKPTTTWKSNPQEGIRLMVLESIGIDNNNNNYLASQFTCNFRRIK